MYEVSFANFISLRPNYFIFVGYLKTRGREGGSSEHPLDTPLAKALVRRVLRRLV